MGKIIITENQYTKIKNFLIEGEISKSFITEEADYKDLGINPQNGTLTVQNTFSAENAQASGRDELKLFKGAVFKVGQNFSSNGILVANTKIQMVGTIAGGAGSAPRQSQVHYYCKTGKFNIPGTPDSYYVEKNTVENIATLGAFTALCKLGKNPQASTQSTAGQTTYNSKNPAQLLGKKDQTKKMTIPANTAFSYNSAKNGIGFKVNYQNGWFDCKSSTFVINSVQYTSKFLADALSKNLCKTSTVEPQKEPKTELGKGNQTSYDGGGGQKLATQNSIVSDMANYV
jgi:hypothetical protein